MKFDVRTNLLFVAGGSTGKAFVYDTKSKAALPEIVLTAKAGSFINDVTLTRDGAWFTNSKYAELYFVPLDWRGELGEVVTRTLDDPSVALKDPATQFGFNGIAAAKGGRVLIVAHSFNQALYTYEPETNLTVRINTDPLPNVDGIIARGKTVWCRISSTRSAGSSSTMTFPLARSGMSSRARLSISPPRRHCSAPRLQW
jgi:sugar lactone lactonase YvrE